MINAKFEERMTYADTEDTETARFFAWQVDNGNYFKAGLSTAGAGTGQVQNFPGAFQCPQRGKW
ncbi:hypothetical protein ACFMBG_23380 [Leisingera sp. D0M16]|uniref:hypothetical protein n=1 Tax=Leisingera coralii TaxID=3351347 RepID=UPI003B77C20F